MLADLAATFPKLYDDSAGSSKPHSAEYRKFALSWGWQKVIYDLADSKITEIEKIYQKYVLDVMLYMTYLIDKSTADEKEDKFLERLRKHKYA